MTAAASGGIVDTMDLERITNMSKMSDIDLQRREDADYEDPFSYYEEGENSYIAGGKNPYERGTYAWSEWKRGWLDTAKSESRDER